MLQVGEAGIRISDLRTNDTASYRVSVRLSDMPNVATQTVDLLVAGKNGHQPDMMEFCPLYIYDGFISLRLSA